MDILQVFPNEVIPVPEAGCWLWAGRVNKDGYGAFGETGRAHRRSYELAFGAVPKGLYVLHKCDIASCVNPSHLYAGTAKDNAADRERRGRRRNLLGKEHGMAKLTDEAVVEIRRLYAEGGISQRALATKFGMSQAMIFYVLKKANWKHV